jgi:hypothetical protein
LSASGADKVVTEKEVCQRGGEAEGSDDRLRADGTDPRSAEVERREGLVDLETPGKGLGSGVTDVVVAESQLRQRAAGLEGLANAQCACGTDEVDIGLYAVFLPLRFAIAVRTELSAEFMVKVFVQSLLFCLFDFFFSFLSPIFDERIHYEAIEQKD